MNLLIFEHFYVSDNEGCQPILPELAVTSLWEKVAIKEIDPFSETEFAFSKRHFPILTLLSVKYGAGSGGGVGIDAIAHLIGPILDT
jgi:hypothetical protein